MASELLRSLDVLSVVLSPLPDGRLHYRAKKGAITLVLQGLVKTCRAPLWHLLTTGEDTELPKKVTLPPTDYSIYRTWQTGKVPAVPYPMGPLPEPKYHDTPSPPRTSKGPPCTKKQCKPTTTFSDGRPASLYFRPSGLCVACWERLDKTTKEEEEDNKDPLLL
jgi:hypothetical protein